MRKELKKNPMDIRKQDSAKNPENLETKLHELRIRDKKKVPFRIDSRTIIYVYPENCTEEYRQKFIKKMKNK